MSGEIESKSPHKNGARDKELGVHVQAGLSLIPYVGGLLSTYFGEIRGRRIIERMNKYFKYFTQRLQDLDQRKIDYAYIESEEFAELFIQGAEQAAKSTTEQKIRRFANILANQVVIDSKTRQRTQSMMSFVDRLSDLDAFILISYGDPHERSMRANTKKEALTFVKKLAVYLGIMIPNKEDVFESIIYMDNLGLTWVNEKDFDGRTEKGEDLILKEFSSFRTPLGDAVVKVITPANFFIPKTLREIKKDWPESVVNLKFKDDLFF